MSMLPPSAPQAAVGPTGSHGFTLVELMLAVVIAGILAAVALPSFQHMVQKGRRADAVATLSAVQQAQERWRANRATYTEKLSDLQFSSDQSLDKHYVIKIVLTNDGATGYTIEANALESSPQAKDSACAKMSITMSGGQMQYLPTTGGCWSR
ncbi:type IV pilin protein [Roseateles cavernae]|uniref:type IV pilin protein n=1 Tax=Roseateles cavernae TaxID=3153578 RepID=UPI0032E461C2